MGYICNCMVGWNSCSCELFTIKILINSREWPRESKAFHYFRHLIPQGDRPNVVFNGLGRHLFRQRGHNCVFQRRRYNAFTQATILGMTSGPGAFVQRYCNDTLALIICLTIMVTFSIDCDVFNALIRYLPLTTLWSHPWNTVKRRATSWNP